MVLSNRCGWDQLPSEILEKIIQQYLNIGDSVRMILVCRTWRSIIKENNIRSGVRVPWLTLPLGRDNKYLRFFDLCEGRIYNFNLPKAIQGACCCGSSKGWLVMCKASKFKSNPQLFLFNPISGVQLPLPSMKTIPSFQTHRRQVAELVDKVELSSVDAENCVVVATFFSGTSLGLCRPGDKRWTMFQGVDGQVDCCEDIIFSNGIVYFFVSRDDEELAPATHVVKVGNRDVVLKLLPNNYQTEASELIWSTREHEATSVWISKNAMLDFFLVESEGDLLVVRKNINIIESQIPIGNILNNDDGEIDNYVSKSKYYQASGFEVFKIDLDHSINNNIHMILTKLDSLGDRMLYVTATGSLSAPATDSNRTKVKNCIFFLANRLRSYYDVAMSRESGVFYLEDGRIERSFPSINNSIHDRMNWFSPNTKF